VTVPISWTGRKFGASLLKERCEVMLVMDWAESGRRAGTYPRAYLALGLCPTRHSRGRNPQHRCQLWAGFSWSAFLLFTENYGE
jgi:hypothetical protein